jgi:hypothetical protein
MCSTSTYNTSLMSCTTTATTSVTT